MSAVVVRCCAVAAGGVRGVRLDMIRGQMRMGRNRQGADGYARPRTTRAWRSNGLAGRLNRRRGLPTRVLDEGGLIQRAGETAAKLPGTVAG